MVKKIFHSKIASLCLFCLLSFVAGGVNGLLGTGGGIIIVYMLRALCKNNTKDNFATSLCITLPLSLFALVAYLKNGSVDFSLAGQAALPVALGGFFGAFLTSRLKTEWLSAIFGVMVSYSGIRMLIP